MINKINVLVIIFGYQIPGGERILRRIAPIVSLETLPGEGSGPCGPVDEYLSSGASSRWSIRSLMACRRGLADAPLHALGGPRPPRCTFSTARARLVSLFTSRTVQPGDRRHGDGRRSPEPCLRFLATFTESSSLKIRFVEFDLSFERGGTFSDAEGRRTEEVTEAMDGSLLLAGLSGGTKGRHLQPNPPTAGTRVEDRTDESSNILPSRTPSSAGHRIHLSRCLRMGSARSHPPGGQLGTGVHELVRRGLFSASSP